MSEPSEPAVELVEDDLQGNEIHPPVPDENEGPEDQMEDQ
jgi:hypothetical protein